MAKSKRKSECPAGYKSVARRVTIREVYRDPSFNICFDLSKAKIYDNYLRDYLGSQCFTDPEKAINVFLRQGYSEDQLREVLNSLGRSKTTLPKPVKLSVTACKSRW